MKQLFCLILTLCLLFSGCAALSEGPPGSAVFYYLRSDYQEDMDSLIQSENRDLGEKQGDLSYLLALYLIGPSGEELTAPLPEDTTVQSVRKIGSTIVLRLSDTGQDLTDSQFTMACACLALTCLDQSDAAEVTIHSGERSITMSRDNLAMIDPPISPTEETQ